MSAFSNLDHFPIYVSLRTDLTPQGTETTYKIIWDYTKLDSDLLTRLLIDTNWEQILDNDVTTATQQFISALLSAAKASIPRKKCR